MMTTKVGSGTLILAPMHTDDIPEIIEIERESFAVMWPAGSYKQEMKSNRMAQYRVLRYRPAPGEVVPPLPVRPARPPFRSRCFPGSVRIRRIRTRTARPSWATPGCG